MMVALTGMNVSCTGMILQSYNSVHLIVHLIFYNSQKKRTRKMLIFRVLLEAPTRFELVIEVLQTFALPLGYGAISNAYLE